MDNTHQEWAGSRARPASLIDHGPGLFGRRAEESQKAHVAGGAPADYRADIDGLRAVAVLAVLLYHVGFRRFSGGFVGVDVFFVISGFLITGLLISELAKTGSISFKRFYLRRVSRLLPAMAVTFVACTVAGYVILSPRDLVAFGKSLVAASISGSNVFFLFDSSYWSSEQIRPLLHTWSLSVEEQFYLVWPATIWVAHRVSAARGVVVAMLGLVAISFGLNLLSADHPTSLFYLTHYRLWELGLGGLLVWVVKRRLPLKLGGQLGALAGVLAIVYSVVTYREGMLFPSYNALLPCIGTALVIVYGSRSLVGRVLGWSPFVWVGRMSYSLYLVHWPLIVLYGYLRIRVVDELTTAERLFLSLASMLIAAFMYQFVEQPTRRAGYVTLKRLPLKVALVGLATVVISGSLGGTMWLGDGWPGRLGETRLDAIAKLAEGGGRAGEPFKGVHHGGDACDGASICIFRGRRGLGEPSAEDEISLVGRSHAQHYVDGFLSAGAKLRYYHVDCPVFFGSFCNNDALATDDIFAWRQAVVKQLVRGKGPIVMSEVLRYSEQRGVKNMTSGQVTKWESGQQWLAFIDARLGEFIGAFPGRKVVLVGETPRFGAPVSSQGCLSRPFPPENCFSSPMSEQRKWYDYNLQLEQLAARHGIAFFNPHRYLCSDDGCHNFVDGHAVYYDSHHFSAYTSRFLVQRLIPILGTSLFRPGGGVAQK